jgi:acetylornithine deacetylase/succinyl-diaminopimelate desuccinylase-like protein
MLRAGVAENALPRSAVATVNCRILPGETPEEVLATLREVVDDDEIEIRPREGGTPPSSPSPIREDVMTILSQAAREFWGEIPFRPRQSSGATDGLWVRRAGIPVYAFGGAVFGQNRRHGLNERIGVEAFHTSVRYWYEVVKAIASQPGKAAERR